MRAYKIYIRTNTKHSSYILIVFFYIYQYYGIQPVLTAFAIADEIPSFNQQTVQDFLQFIYIFRLPPKTRKNIE